MNKTTSRSGAAGYVKVSESFRPVAFFIVIYTVMCQLHRDMF
jgi:hypothetical protein